MSTKVHMSWTVRESCQIYNQKRITAELGEKCQGEVVGPGMKGTDCPLLSGSDPSGKKKLHSNCILFGGGSTHSALTSKLSTGFFSWLGQLLTTVQLPGSTCGLLSPPCGLPPCGICVCCLHLSSLEQDVRMDQKSTKTKGFWHMWRYTDPSCSDWTQTKRVSIQLTLGMGGPRDQRSILRLDYTQLHKG